MKNKIVLIIEESLEGGYETKTLGYSIISEAENLEELKKNIKEPVAYHFKNSEMPKLIEVK